MPNQIPWPLEGGLGRVSSRAGQRNSPGGIGSTNHRGLDIAAPIGTGVIAPVAGTVITARPAGGFGNLVEVQGVDGNKYRFAHLNNFAVTPGQVIGAGQRLGTVGNTGNSTGPHLHFEIRAPDGSVIDPSSRVDRNTKPSIGDRLGDAAKDLGQTALDKAGDAAKGALNYYAPGLGDAVGGVTGIGSEGTWIEQLQKWIKESGIFQRIALAFLAFIFIAAALFMFGKGTVIENVVGKAGSALKNAAN